MDPVNFYKCLADDTRLKCLMLVADRIELCVCDLTEALALSQPKISRHLAELRKQGLLQDERRGRWVFYRLDPELPAWAVTVIQQTLAHNRAFIVRHQARLPQSNSCDGKRSAASGDAK